jgi:hypothetical protein
MIRFFLDKFRDTPGPLQQVRLVAGDLAEEVLDIAEHYLKRLQNGNDSEFDQHNACCSPTSEKTESPHDNSSPKTEREGMSTSTSAPSTARADSGPSVDVPSELAAAIDFPANKKKQEFKILAILWDIHRCQKGPTSAKEVSKYGKKLNLSIRHENVRKVIRMKLDKQVDIKIEEVGNTKIYVYEISGFGIEYFRAKYMSSDTATST